MARDFHNAILTALPLKEQVAVEQLLEFKHLEPGQALQIAQVPVKHVWFLETGLASECVGKPGKSLAVGMTGSEGLIGLPIISGTYQAPTTVVMESSGSAWRISAEHFLRATNANPDLEDLCRRFLQVHGWQMAAAALVAVKGNVEQRLARWLLMCLDRIDGNHIAVTHDHLATSLGVRRPGVTNAFHVLEGNGLLRSRRSDVEITNRDGLKLLAGDLYGMPEREYERLFGRRQSSDHDSFRSRSELAVPRAS